MNLTSVRARQHEHSRMQQLTVHLVHDKFFSLIDGTCPTMRWNLFSSSQPCHDAVTRYRSCRVPRVVARLFGLVENVGEVALSAVLAVVHGGHEDTSTALRLGALTAEALDLAITVDLVVLEDS